MGLKLAAEVAAGKVSQATVNASVLRILTPMFTVGLFDIPNNNSIHTKWANPDFVSSQQEDDDKEKRKRRKKERGGGRTRRAKRKEKKAQYQGVARIF